MDVFLTSPWIPAEWVRAHGLQPRGIWSAENFQPGAWPLSAGVCAFAEAAVRFAGAQTDSAVIFSTACDQLRRGFDAAILRGQCRAFLFNLPATWQTPAAGKYSAPNWNGWDNFFWRTAAGRRHPKSCGRKCCNPAGRKNVCSNRRQPVLRADLPKPWRDFIGTALFRRRRLPRLQIKFRSPWSAGRFSRRTGKCWTKSRPLADVSC